MAARVCAAFALLAHASGVKDSRINANLVADVSKNRPVTKVITLLSDMLKQMETEAEEDQKIYDKMACWCETNDKDKTGSIAWYQSRVSDLTSKVEEYTAVSGRLNTEIANNEKEVAQNQAALDKATAIREKQLAEFNAEEKDLLGSISALKAAITVLSKHKKGALIQVPRTHLMGVAATLGDQMRRHDVLLEGVLTPSQRKAANEFVRAPEEFLQQQQPTNLRQSYAPQSGEIFGILSNMKETFQADLASSQKDEAANQKAYEDLKAAKEAEIRAGQAQLDSKTQEAATTVQKLAEAKQDIVDSENALSADDEFLLMLRDKCQKSDKEWQERTAARRQEMEAVSKARAILSSDDAKDNFGRTFNPSFVQLADSAQADRRTAASSLLSRVAHKVQSPKLAELAVQMRLDAFTKVKQAIEDMVAQLIKEKQDEIAHRDYCIDELNKNEAQTEKKEREKEGLAAKVEDLAMTIDQFDKAIGTLKAEIAEMQVQLKRAGEDREKQNKEFQTTVADQRETQKLLQQALGALSDFYNKAAKAPKAAFAQKQKPARPPPPPGFDGFKKNAGSGGVMLLLQQIISDAKAMEAEIVKSEADAQEAYEDFVKETNKSVEAKSKAIVNKTEDKAKAETDKVKAEQSKESVTTELQQLASTNGELHGSCDFTLKNFDLRQSARDEEVEALKQAKAILSGANFSETAQA